MRHSFASVIQSREMNMSRMPLVERYRLKMNCLAVLLLHSSWSRKMDNILSISVLRSTRHLVWDSMRHRFQNRLLKNTVKL